MVWHFSSKQDSDKLDLLNKRILPSIFTDFNSEYNNWLKRAGTTANLKDKRLQNIILTIFKCLHFSDYPSYLKDMFRLRSSTYFLRGHNMLCLLNHSPLIMASIPLVTWQQYLGIFFWPSPHYLWFYLFSTIAQYLLGTII